MRGPLLLLTLLVLTPPAAAQSGLPTDPAEFETTLVDLAESSRARTVLVYGLIGLGSGAVVSHDGVVVTNAHVVAGARYGMVQWSDGELTLMKRRGIDYGRDLAVLEPAEPLGRWVPAFSLRPDRPADGEWVMAIGFPGGPRGNFDATVTLGRVLGRNADAPAVNGILNYADAIETDAPIFSGNSGGPLVDVQGRLVGINGAGNLQKATSLAIPTELVASRLELLKDDLILLPGERRLEPSRNVLLRGIYNALDKVARQIPARTAEGARSLMQTGELGIGEALALDESWTPSGPVDRLSGLAAKSLRQEALAGALVRSGGAVWLGEVPGTRLGPNHAVCKARRVGNRRQLTTKHGPARVVAVSVADDLALVELPAALRGDAPADAPHRPTGTFAYVPRADATPLAGIVSAGRRPTSATLAARIQGGGPALMGRLIDGLSRLAERLKSQELQDLVAQLKQAIEMREAFSSGTPPHSYPVVLSVDVPLGPSQVGAPALDRQGRVIGVTVGIPHHGTAYVVPLDRARAAFSEHLPASRVPEARQGAKLY